MLRVEGFGLGFRVEERVGFRAEGLGLKVFCLRPMLSGM